MDRPYIILAPHVDDEAIGCFSLLHAQQVSHVFYFFETDQPSREYEARQAADRFGFLPVLHRSPMTDIQAYADTLAQLLSDNPAAVVLMPAITDSHPDHKAVNMAYRQLVPAARRLFYSVDLQDCPGKVRAYESKRAVMSGIYPSQRSLWDADASYYLFECIRRYDYTRLANYMTSPGVVIWAPDLSEVKSNLDDLADSLLRQGRTPFLLESHSKKVYLL